MASTSDTLKWSSQLQVSNATRASRLIGDKITLPQSALEALLAAAPIVSVSNGFAHNHTSAFDPFNPYSYAAERHAREQLSDRQQQLPHPLTFRIVNPRNGRAVYAGIREFSAEDNEVELSSFLREALGLEASEVSRRQSREGTPHADVDIKDMERVKSEMVTVHARQLPKGTYVRLRPLEAGYDPEDWKSLLERYLRDNFTTLTNGEILTVPGSKHEHFKFMIDRFEPEGEAICVVDTDLEVDIEALNEEQARETLNRRLAKARRAPGTAQGSSAGGLLAVGREEYGQVLPGEYVDYELKQYDKARDLEVMVETVDDALVDLFVSPFSARQRSKPRDDEHIFGDFASRPAKRLKLSRTNVTVEEAEYFQLSVHASASHVGDRNQPVTYTISVTNTNTAQGANSSTADSAQAETLPPDETVCKNCRQHIPKRTLPLHEAFCYRNNILCPKCSNVFLKSSDTWKSHWHCPHDDEHGNSSASRAKHDAVFHPLSPLQCQSCDFQAFNLPILAQHRTTTCPGKEILCQFCHLVVPQQGPDDPSFTDAEVLLSGLTPHELTDGARTTECHICNKIVRLRDMRTHLLLHERERINKVKPKMCANRICGRTIKAGDEARVQREQLGLCNECFGPLYVTTYDPEGKALRRRIERRLLSQLMAGCGKPWCHNDQWCRTGRKSVTGEDRVVSAKDALPIVRPIMDQLAKGDSSGLVFCSDENGQTRREMAGMVAGEGEYDVEWACKALEEGRGDLGKARIWLKDRAPRIGEIVR